MPRSKKDVQSFLGFVNFYRCFIQDFSHHALPLFDLTKNNIPFTWLPEAQATFNMLKLAVTSAPILAFPQDDLPYRVEADSSDFAMGAVLSQQSREDGKWHPVAFYSKSLSPVEHNYEIHDKDMLVIVCALEEWRHFLEGAAHPIKIFTNHKNLKYFMLAKKLNHHQARWSLFLARFDFTLRHWPGCTMGKPDALSRCLDHGDGSGDNMGVTLLKPAFFAVRALEAVELVGEEHGILSEIRRGNCEGQQEDTVAKAACGLKESSCGSVHSSEWSVQDGLLSFHGKIYVPNDSELYCRIMAQHHDTKVAGHPGHWKRWSLWDRTTGGCRCPATLRSTARPATCATAPRSSVNAPLVSSIHFLSLRHAGT